MIHDALTNINELNFVVKCFLSLCFGSFVVTSRKDQCPGQNAYMQSECTPQLCARAQRGLMEFQQGLHRGLQPVSVYVSDFTR